MKQFAIDNIFFRFSQGHFDCPLQSYTHYPRLYVNTNNIHTHPHSEIMCVLNGSGTYTQNHKVQHVKSGDIIFINAFTPHGESATEEVMEYVIFAVNTFMFGKMQDTDFYDFISNASSQEAFDKILIFSLPSLLPLIKETVKIFDQEIAETPPQFEDFLQAQFNCTLITILRNTMLRPIVSPDKLSNTYSLPMAVKLYLNNSFAVDHTLDELAKRFFVSKNYLALVFKRTFGMTPSQYLKNIRIDKARELLCDTNHSVSEVAEMTGFVNASYFARVYKQCTGRTPTEEINRQ